MSLVQVQLKKHMKQFRAQGCICVMDIFSLFTFPSSRTLVVWLLVYGCGLVGQLCLDFGQLL